MVEVCEGAPVAVGGWILTDRHDLVPSLPATHTPWTYRACAAGPVSGANYIAPTRLVVGKSSLDPLRSVQFGLGSAGDIFDPDLHLKHRIGAPFLRGLVLVYVSSQKLNIAQHESYGMVW